HEIVWNPISSFANDGIERWTLDRRRCHLEGSVNAIRADREDGLPAGIAEGCRHENRLLHPLCAFFYSERLLCIRNACGIRGGARIGCHWARIARVALAVAVAVRLVG